MKKHERIRTVEPHHLVEVVMNQEVEVLGALFKTELSCAICVLKS